MDITKYQPLDDRILILPDPQDEMVGGLFVAEENKPKKLTGTVVAVGTGVPLINVKLEIKVELDPNAIRELKELIELLNNGRKMDLSPGDRVIYGQFAGTRVPLDGKEYLILRRSDVFMTENS